MRKYKTCEYINKCKLKMRIKCELKIAYKFIN